MLAFANLSHDPENEYFSDGISEELLNVLAKVPGTGGTPQAFPVTQRGTGGNAVGAWHGDERG